MRPFHPLFLLAALLPAFAAAAEDCSSIAAHARGEQVRVAGDAASRRVGGTERAHFFSAPDRRCKLRELFVIPGDALQAHSEYGVFTEVRYVHPRTGRTVTGWLESGRLEAR